MHSDHPISSRNIPIVCLLVLAWFVYLSTLSPTVFYRDTPEFVDTAFALGVSHPAGFPIYNLMAKAVTFFPMGSIPFKVNLFSSLAACFALGVLYWTCVTFLRVLSGPQPTSSAYVWSSLVPVGLMAFCLPFWSNTMLAEVYTLHTLFTVSVIGCLLKWKEQGDIRYLYSAALIYGLSAGNHGTVAFFLPAILVLFFFWCHHHRWRHLTLCSVFFLLGFSIYLYLPIRSLAEPTFDWGNPETLREFLFHITDRKDSHTHFDVLSPVAASSPAMAEVRSSALDWFAALYTNIKHIGWVFIRDIYQNLTLVPAIGFLGGAVLCFRKSLPFFLFCAVIVGINIAFFTSWRGEAFLPSYIIVTLFTALFLNQFLFTRWWQPAGDHPESLEHLILHKRGLLGIRWGRLAMVLAGLAIPWTMIERNYIRVDHSWNHLSETLTRQVYLTLPDRAVFVSGLSWFFYNYNQDVRRLRDDVTAVTVWDLLSPHRTGLLTPKRYPDFVLPDTRRHDFKSLEGISHYSKTFMEANAVSRPVVMEQISVMYEQTDFTPRWRPYRNVLLQYNSPHAAPDSELSHTQSWAEFKGLLEAELSRPGSGRDMDWLNNPRVWMYSMRDYFHTTGQYELEREVLAMIGRFLGQSQNPQWIFQYLDNLIADGRLSKANLLLDRMQQVAPESYEAWLARGLLARAEGRLQEALDSFQQAVQRNPRSFRVHLEMARTLKTMKMNPLAAFHKAKSLISNVRDLTEFNEELNRKS